MELWVAKGRPWSWRCRCAARSPDWRSVRLCAVALRSTAAGSSSSRLARAACSSANQLTKALRSGTDRGSSRVRSWPRSAASATRRLREPGWRVARRSATPQGATVPRARPDRNDAGSSSGCWRGQTAMGDEPASPMGRSRTQDEHPVARKRRRVVIGRVLGGAVVEQPPMLIAEDQPRVFSPLEQSRARCR